MIPVQLKEKLVRNAKAKGISMGELIRDYLSSQLEEDKHGNVNSLRKLIKHAKKSGDSLVTSENFRETYKELRKYNE